jgi:hypothetical protein
VQIVTIVDMEVGFWYCCSTTHISVGWYKMGCFYLVPLLRGSGRLNCIFMNDCGPLPWLFRTSAVMMQRRVRPCR